MSKPMSAGRDPRVDVILAQLNNGEISRPDALKALLDIGLIQFSEDFENGHASETRQTDATQRSKAARRTVFGFAWMGKNAAQKS